VEIDMDALKKKAREGAKVLEGEVVQFLRDIVRIPSESCKEQAVVLRIKEEMDKVGFDETYIDKMGSVIGRIGGGSRVILYDAHVDTVGVGDPKAWEFDPYEGKVEDGIVYGRGAGDDKGCTAVQVYGAKLMKDLAIEEDLTLYVIGTVQEEDFDGLALKYALEHSFEKKPEFVVLGESTSLDVYRGQRGRVELVVRTKGQSCHASAPERGVNAIYKAQPIIEGIRKLNEDGLADDPFLGKGTIAVTKVECETPSVNALADSCTIYIDRRLTLGETVETAMEEIRALPGFGDAEILVTEYKKAGYTGLEFPEPVYCPTWVLEEEHPLCRAAMGAARAARGSEPELSHWIFSTNGVASMGTLGIPSIGFGPGHEVHAHTVNDSCPVDHMVTAVAFYALFPSCLMREMD